MDISFFTRQAFQDVARFGPDRAAIGLENEPALSYAELSAGSHRYANALLDLGVEAGDRVGILLYNNVEYWLAYFAITRIGAIAVRLNFRLGTNELQYALEDSGSTVLLADPELLERIEPVRAEVPVRHYVSYGAGARLEWALPWSVLTDGAAIEPDLPLPHADAPAMLMYTSGTTGRPKGALWTHGTTTWWTALQIMEWGFTKESVTMVTGPLYHIGALENYAMPTLAVGGRVVLLRSKDFDLGRTLRIVSEQKVTDLLLFPSMTYQMLELDGVENIDLTHLRRIFTGGDSLLPSAGKRLTELCPWVDLVQLYGLTEGTPMITCGAPGFAKEHPESVGRAYPFAEVSIRDDDGKVLSPGDTGEIWTRSPANAVGYWNKPEATAATFVDGWCRTGDLGVVEAGTLRIAGRKKDMIRSGGENIYPVEIEDVLLQHPDIVDAAVVGLPDPRLVESVCAVVVLAPGSSMSDEDVVAHCTSRLASFKKPRRVVFLDELPRTPSQKVMKYVLREELGKQPVG